MAEQKQCFVISPIGEPDSDIRAEADWVLYQMIKPVLEPEFKVTRADAFPKIHVITTEVINSIRRADLVVADMTGHNANVFYELAVAHAYHRPVVPLIREGQLPPFDTMPMGTIIYSRSRHEKWEAAKQELRRSSEEATKPEHKVSNPITMAIGHEKASQSGDDLANLVASLTRDVAALKTAVSPMTAPSVSDALGLLRPNYLDGISSARPLSAMLAAREAASFNAKEWEVQDAILAASGEKLNKLPARLRQGVLLAVTAALPKDPRMLTKETIRRVVDEALTDSAWSNRLT